MSLPSISCWMLLILAAVPWSARAQPPQERPVSIGAVGGLSAASGTGGATIGATVAFDVAPRIGLEIRGAWLDRGAGSSASEVTGNVLIDLLALRSAAPHIVAGDVGHMWTGPWQGATYAASQMPAFSANRMGQMGARKRHVGHAHLCGSRSGDRRWCADEPDRARLGSGPRRGRCQCLPMATAIPWAR